MAYEHVRVLRVEAFGHSVGAVAASSSGRAYEFEYDPAWKRRGIDLAPALMSSRARRSRWSFPTLAEQTFRLLPPMLAESVPDFFGNAVIDAALAREGLEQGDISALDRLAYVGGRGMGALNFVPEYAASP